VAGASLEQNTNNVKHYSRGCGGASNQNSKASAGGSTRTCSANNLKAGGGVGRCQQRIQELTGIAD
jgi:hypothetical protein